MPRGMRLAQRRAIYIVEYVRQAPAGLRALRLDDVVASLEPAVRKAFAIAMPREQKARKTGATAEGATAEGATARPMPSGGSRRGRRRSTRLGRSGDVSDEPSERSTRT